MTHVSDHRSCSNTTVAELTAGSNTLPTVSTNLRVTMQRKSGTALIWHDKRLGKHLSTFIAGPTIVISCASDNVPLPSVTQCHALAQYLGRQVFMLVLICVLDFCLQAPGPRLDPEDPSVWLLPLLQVCSAGFLPWSAMARKLRASDLSKVCMILPAVALV